MQPESGFHIGLVPAREGVPGAGRLKLREPAEFLLSLSATHLGADLIG